MQSVRVDIPPAPPTNYDVVVGPGATSELGPRTALAIDAMRQRLGWAPGGAARRAFLVIDQALPAVLQQRAKASLQAAGFDVTEARIAVSEANKTLDSAQRLLHQITSTRHERFDPVVALGGGVVGDLAGFVAATYRRGVPVVQCPTTLLSMVDASVGGKTGVNIHSRVSEPAGASSTPGPSLRKNLVGAFWQPLLVLADTEALASLPERHLRSGLAECLKHGLLCAATDPGLFRWTNESLIKIRMGDWDLAEQLIVRNVRVKAGIVGDDERELSPSGKGGRALLNLGHTFGHAIETIHHLSPDGTPASAPLQHGEAVALGLVAASACSHALWLIDRDARDDVRVAVERLGMPSRLIGLPDDQALLHSMAHDKKADGGKLRLVLLAGLGSAVVVDDPPHAAVLAGWSAIRA
jgi:3-dehydroquinate synthetase